MILVKDKSIKVNNSNGVSTIIREDTTASLSNLGITATSTEINYLSGVTSNVQSQISTLVSTDSNLQTQISTLVSTDINLQEQINNISPSSGRLGAVKMATITTTWAGTSAPYTQDITINGFTVDSTPIISPLYSEINDTAILQKDAWNLIGKITTGTDKITVTCFEEVPTIEITIQLIGG